MLVPVLIRTVTGVVHELEGLDSQCDVEQLYQQASQALNLPVDRFKLVLKGNTLLRATDETTTNSSSSSSSNQGGSSLLSGRATAKKRIVHLSAGDVLLVMPQRKAPSERLQRAAAEAQGVDLGDEDDAPLRFSLRPGAAAWEHWLARFLQDKCQAPELLLIWLFHIGPARLLILAAVLAGAKLASYYDLGPVYILLAIIVFIFTHLGRKAEGEASAYSVFNPGVRRLPGQLDADVLDEQIRRGQM